MDSNITRKGATSTRKVPAAIQDQLNAGMIESKTLSETLVVDFTILAQNLGLTPFTFSTRGIVKKMQEAGLQLPNWQDYAAHTSDTVRGWAAYRLAQSQNLTFLEKLESMRIFAADPHFGVREWAWLALRPFVIQNLDVALSTLPLWTLDSSPHIRRFASEITRPRGVWCAHIPSLKVKPALGLDILEPLKSDTTKYVRDSVGNWLNDAAKTDPDWVMTVTRRWHQESPTKETCYIVKKGLRSLPHATGS